MIQAIDPRDEVEAMLAAQMAAVHLATMTFARRLNHVETHSTAGQRRIAANKLARTFAPQMETLKKYRSAASSRSP